MKKRVNNCTGYIGQIQKNRDFRKFEKSAPSNIEHLVEISMFFMTWSTVQHPETLTPSSILIFKAHRLVPVSDLFIRFQRDFYKHPQKLQLFFLVFICLLKDICVVKIGFGNKEKKLRWGLSTRVLNLVVGTKKSTILVRFVGGS